MDQTKGRNVNAEASIQSKNLKAEKDLNGNKIKPSKIPRRTPMLIGEDLDSVQETQQVATNQYIPIGRNIQRVQLLIPDIFPEEKQETASVASSRPIPTLRQIYGHVNIIDSSRYDGWLMGFETPTTVFLIDSNQTSLYSDYVDDSNSNNYDSNTSNYSELSTLEQPTSHTTDELQSATTSSVKTGSEDTSMLISEIEFPSRDNESGYQSMTLTSNNLETSLNSDRTERSMSLNNNELLEAVKLDHELNSTVSSINSYLTRVIDTKFDNYILNTPSHPINDDFKNSMFMNYDQCNRAVSPMNNDLKTPVIRSNNDIVRSMSSSNSNIKKLISADNKEISKRNLNNKEMNKTTISMNNKFNSMTNKTTESNKLLNLPKNDTSVTVSPNKSRIQSATYPVSLNNEYNLMTSKQKEQNDSSNKGCISHCCGKKRLESDSKLEIKKSRPSHDYYHTYKSSKDSITGKNIISNTVSIISNQSTVVICKSPEKDDHEAKLRNTNVIDKCTGNTKPDVKYYNSHGSDSVRAVEDMAVPSYTEYLSEILQKTTNFEAMEGLDSKFSSNNTIIDIQDNLPLTGTIETSEELGAHNQSSLHRAEPSPPHNIYLGTEAWRCRSDRSAECHRDSSLENSVPDRHSRVPYYLGHSDHRRSSRYRKFPSNRFKAPRIIPRWRWHPSYRRVYRRRWNFMCKSTQPNWTHWSSWPPAIRKKYLLMHFLQHSVIWEDAVVQTNSLISQETGTDYQLMALKSTANSAIASLQDIGPITRDPRYFSAPVFPFLYNSTLTSRPVNTLHMAPESKNISCFESPTKMLVSIGASDNVLWNASHGIHSPLEEKCCQYEETLPSKSAGIGRDTSHTNSEKLQKCPTNVEIATSLVHFVDVITSKYSDKHPVKPANIEIATSFVRPVDVGTCGADPELPIKTINVERATSFVRFADVQTSELIPKNTINVEKATSLMKMETSGNYSEIITNKPAKIEKSTSLLQPVDVATSDQISLVLPINTINVQTATSLTQFIETETSFSYSGVLPTFMETGTSLIKVSDNETLNNAETQPLNTAEVEKEEGTIQTAEIEDTNEESETLQNDPPVGKVTSLIRFVEVQTSGEGDLLRAQPDSKEKPLMESIGLKTSDNYIENITTTASADRVRSFIQNIDYDEGLEKTTDTQNLSSSIDECSSKCSCSYNCRNISNQVSTLLDSNNVGYMCSGSGHRKSIEGVERTHTEMKAVNMQTSKHSSGLDVISLNYAATNTPTVNNTIVKITKDTWTDVNDKGTELDASPTPKHSSKSTGRKNDNITYYKLCRNKDNGTQKSHQSMSGFKVAVKTPTLTSKVEKRSTTFRSEKNENGCQTITGELCYYTGSVSVQTLEKGLIPIADQSALVSVLSPGEVKEQNRVIKDAKNTSILTSTEPNITSISSDAMPENISNRVIITEQKSVFTSTSKYGTHRERQNEEANKGVSTASKLISTMNPYTEENSQKDGIIACAISTSVTNLDSCSKDTVSTCTRSTSVLGLNSFLEAEILLSNLIKKALIDVDTQASRLMEFRDSIKTYPSFATKSTYTCVGLDSKSIWVNSSKVAKLCLDTCVQVEDSSNKIIDIKEAPCRNTVSSMTSYYGQTESVQTTLIKKESEKCGQNVCACVAPSSQDCDTNTDNLFNSSHIMQPSVLQVQKSVEVSSNPFTNSLTSKSQLKSNLNNQLISLSRLIGTRKKASSCIDTYAPTAVLSSNLDADKWMRACTSTQKDAYAYQSCIRPEKEFDSSPLPAKSSTSAIFSFFEEKNSTVPSDVKNLVINDSLADVLPLQKRNHNYDKHKHLEPTYQMLMVDAVTSDQALTRNRQEFEHQAVPTVHETGIGTNSDPIFQHRSASVLTSKCILPTCTACNYVLNSGKAPHTPCKFVYGNPTCVVHNQSSNVEVQTTGAPRAQVGMVQVETLVERSDVGVLTPFFGMLPVPEHFSKKKSSVIGTILSPKVYKALYDTTKMIVNEDTDEQPVRDSSAVPAPAASDRNTPTKKGLTPSSMRSGGIHHERTTKSTKTATNNTAQTSSNLLRTQIINVPLEGKATGDCIKIYKRDSRKKSIQQNSSQNTYEYIKVIALNESKIEDLHNNVSNGSEGKKSPNITEKEKHGVDIEQLKDIQIGEDPKTSQGCREQDSQEDNKRLEASTVKPGESEDHLKTNLVTSCRYYSTLLSKQLGKVKDNLTKHLTIAPEEIEVGGNQDPLLSICTMKPSGRENLACQTVKRTFQQDGGSHLRVLSPATCLTDICKNDKDHLKSVYTILSAIEGRMRRLNIDSRQSLTREDRWL
ncbi:unnamed protein product [Arctia plantaginis]|uniref:Uncharacterized protein n=1 Tax=Arctia plantaginis TaxID=874455 RepID=A0A8S1AF21_ARCPL|nr:unnamed protein product [Arctia plantaginis]